MFGSKSKAKDNSSNTTTTTSSPSLNSLVKGTLIEGTINSEHDFRIDGKVKGHLNCQARVIIGPYGFVDGEINCQNAVIEGTFTGILKVKDTLQIKDSAKVEGDITTDKLSVQPGAIFNVSCIMQNGMKKSKDQIKRDIPNSPKK